MEWNEEWNGWKEFKIMEGMEGHSEKNGNMESNSGTNLNNEKVFYHVTYRRGRQVTDTQADKITVSHATKLLQKLCKIGGRASLQQYQIISKINPVNKTT